MIVYTPCFLILHIVVISSRFHEKSVWKDIFHKELNKFECDIHDIINTYKNEVEKSPFKNRSVSQITKSWQSTFPDGNYRTNTKNSIPYHQMALRDPNTILRMAEYQAMVYCKSNSIINLPSDISSIINMSKKNLRVGNFTIEATGFDKKNILFWYIASNILQQSIVLVHRGTSKSNTSRFFVFIIIGHSLGAAWAFLNAGYFTSLNDINQRMTAIYTFGQPLLGSALFVNEITTKLNTPIQRYVRIVNQNDLIPHISCHKCIQPEYSNEKWIMNTNSVIWKDCHGGQDLKCSSGISCRKLSWSNHSAVGRFSMRSEFCRIASNS